MLQELYYTFKMEKLELEFKEYTKGLLRDKSSVWNHFLRTSDGVHAQCKKCKKIMKCQNSTTCLHSHLKLHPIEANVERSATATSSKTQPNLLEELDENEPRKKKGKLMDIYLKKSEDDNMENIITKMTACDGLPFSIFSTSGSMRKLFSKSGYDQLPKSPNTLKKIVIEKNEQLKRDLNKEMENLKATGQKFSVSLDEWTSARNRRYMNVNVHCPKFQGKSFRNLGLARITGRGTADRCANILRDKLASYDLSLKDDIACIVTDGASVMCNMGRQVPSYHQLCLAHGIQCAVLDVIYKKAHNDHEEEETGEDDESDDDGEEEGGFVIEQHRNRNLHYRDVNLKNTIDKVRKIVRMFRKSPTKGEFLNNYLPQNQKKMGLILDCKTRWSSLADMITRFLELKDAIMKALIDLKEEVAFSLTELDLLKELSASLNIIKATVEALCEENANLLTAETALQFMVTNLQAITSFTSDRLLEALKNRITERRLLDLVCTLKYLHNPSKYYSEQPSLIFPSPRNDTIVSVITRINEEYFCTRQEIDDDEDDIALVHVQQQQRIEATQSEMSFKEQLQKKITDTISATPSTSTANLSDREELETSIRMQMALFDRGGPRQVSLSQAYEFLLCIPPTSVECERVFSSSKYICNHLRCSLSDDSIDALSFLRSQLQGKR